MADSHTANASNATGPREQLSDTAQSLGASQGDPVGPEHQPEDVETGSVGSASAQHLRVDSDETDSALGDPDDFASSTASLRSSLLENVVENGRTYHKYKQGTYLLPNDEIEQNRLDLQHHLSKLTLHGKLHLAPLKPNIHNALDFGTGTGIWAIEFAQQYPSAHVLGTDLSPIQPLYVPPNCRFEVDDAEDDWLYKQKFDYIHGRFMCTCFKDPAGVFKKAFNSLAPGGYFEMFDFTARFGAVDDSLRGTNLEKFSDRMIEGAGKLGRYLEHAPNYKAYFEEAGFVDVVEKKFQWPFNTWPKGKYFKSLGMWFNQDMHEGLSGMVMATFTRALGMTRDEVELFLVDVRKDLDNRNIHAYLPLFVVYGRKPE